MRWDSASCAYLLANGGQRRMDWRGGEGGNSKSSTACKITLLIAGSGGVITRINLVQPILYVHIVRGNQTNQARIIMQSNYK